ncbi:MAG: hypothetical protein ACK50I_02685 [Burkholderiales bacterium]
MADQPMPQWARVLASASSAALSQAATLFGGVYSTAELGLMAQAVEDMESAARMLRMIAGHDAEQVRR